MAAPLAYPATRYAVAPPIDLSDRSERARLSADAIRAFFNIMARWKIRDEEARLLLGGISNGAFYGLKKQGDRVLDEDRLQAHLLPGRHLQGPEHPLRRGTWPTAG